MGLISLVMFLPSPRVCNASETGVRTSSVEQDQQQAEKSWVKFRDPSEFKRFYVYGYEVKEEHVIIVLILSAFVVMLVMALKGNVKIDNPLVNRSDESTNHREAMRARKHNEEHSNDNRSNSNS